jgi:hypothetical protein
MRTGMRMRIQIQNQKLKKICAEIFFEIFGSKLQFTYLQASIKDAQATEEALSPQKKTFSTSKQKIV